MPLLETSVPVVAPLLREKNSSLIFCPTDLWFESKLLSVILIVPAPVRKVADAFTAFPPEEAPAAVKVVVFPNAAGPHNSTTQIRRNNLINLTPSYLAQSAPSLHRTSAGVYPVHHQRGCQEIDRYVKIMLLVLRNKLTCTLISITAIEKRGEVKNGSCMCCLTASAGYPKLLINESHESKSLRKNRRFARAEVNGWFRLDLGNENTNN
jgi:hypothetical protein